MCIRNYEAIRERYRPETVKVLFVGESRPANGTFFYLGNSRLYKYTCRAFNSALVTSLQIPTFLNEFCSLGCFLLDLCPEPVNHLPSPERRRVRRNGTATLSAILRDIQPCATIVVMRGIAQYVDQAYVGAGIQTDHHYVLPFPARGHEQEYIDGLKAILLFLADSEILNQAWRNS